MGATDILRRGDAALRRVVAGRRRLHEAAKLGVSPAVGRPPRRGASVRALIPVGLAAGAHMVPSVVSLGQWAPIRSLPGDLCRWRGPTGSGVALTFDDGPDPRTTPVALDRLDELGLVATFFCLGTQVASHPDLVAEIRRRGHQVETHGYRHAHHFVRTPRWVRADLDAADRRPGAGRRASAVVPSPVRPDHGGHHGRGPAPRPPPGAVVRVGAGVGRAGCGRRGATCPVGSRSRSDRPAPRRRRPLPSGVVPAGRGRARPHRRGSAPPRSPGPDPRPPGRAGTVTVRRALFLSGTLGAGHDTLAEACAAALAPYGVESRIVDCLPMLGGGPSAVGNWVFRRLLALTPVYDGFHFSQLRGNGAVGRLMDRTAVKVMLPRLVEEVDRVPSRSARLGLRHRGIRRRAPQGGPARPRPPWSS